ncbi:MAG TPA: hypothetical protein VJ969_02240, partial [Desulfopila sp.]|nr:hypothetical protein [Desulfopila sp.]
MRAFNGRSSFATFLRSLTFRLLEDFSRRKFGRVQAPLWIRRLGGIWLLAYTLVCLERLSLADATQRCAQMPASPSASAIENICLQIKTRISGCGSHQRLGE